MSNILIEKKILFISYHFPPDAAVGALRTQKFVKYLPEQSLKPFVLTVHDKYYPTLDLNRLDDVEGVLIERTSFWRTPLQLVIDIRDNHIRRRSSHLNPASQSIRNSKSKKTKGMRYIKRFLAGLNWLPDDRLYWFIPGFRKGMRLIKNNNIQHIVVSAPPHSSLILAYFLAVWSSSKLVVDFRDPWCLSGIRSHSAAFKPNVLLSIENAIQKHILKQVSAVLTTNDFFRNAILKDNSFLSQDKVHVVHNGFDSSDYQPPYSNNCSSCAKYIISYLGTFYMDRTPDSFLTALSRFMLEKGLSESDIEVRFIGDVEQAEGLPVKKMINDAGLENIVMLMDRVEYTQALRLMGESDLLLLLAPNQPYQVPAKTYEYMAAECPILALTEEGATSSLIEEFHCGISVNPQDIQGMIIALHRFYDDYVDGGQSYVCDATPFERRNQAAQLATILRQIDSPID